MAERDTTGERTLPPGLSASEFDTALAALEAELSSDRVLRDRASVDEYRDPFAYATWDQFTGSAVVQPVTVEEVQAIIRIANEYRIPLWTHSQGRNNGYGGPAPRVKGSIIVSLRKMNCVLEINEELAYAVVEPGVRWFDLYEAIQRQGHRLMASIADLGWGSVVGNTLDHGITYGPDGQDFSAPCGMEVVLANGDVLRTGMGAMPENRAWHTYKKSLGPGLDPLFMQSNFGIVTKMGVWLRPYPEAFHPFFIKAWKDEDLGPLLDTLRKLRLDGTIQGIPSFRNTLLIAGVVSRRSQWTDSNDPIDDATIDRIARELNLGRWSGRGGLWGDREVVLHNFQKVKRAFEDIPGVEVAGELIDPDAISERENYAERIFGGVPNMEINHVTGWYGGSEHGGHIGFSPVVALTASEGERANRFLRDLIEREARLDYQVAVFNVNARSIVNVVMMLFDAADEEQNSRAVRTARLMVEEAAKQGFGEYRAHLDFMDLAAEQFSFGDHSYRRFVEAIKDAVDPNGILAPGKQGIWPAAFRPERP